MRECVERNTSKQKKVSNQIHVQHEDALCSCVISLTEYTPNNRCVHTVWHICYIFRFDGVRERHLPSVQRMMKNNLWIFAKIKIYSLKLQ